MTPRRMLAAAGAVLVLISCGSHAYAETEFALGFGYAHVSLDGTSIGAFDEQGGGRFEPRISFNLLDDRPQFRLGFGVGLSGFYDETDGSAAFIDDDGDIIIADADDYEQLALINPELQLSWRERLNDKWTIEGGVGVGAIVGIYEAGEQFFNEFYDEDLDESDVTWAVRPFLRVAYEHDEEFSIGLEASYLWGGELEFTNEIGGDVEQWYVGAFFAFSR